MDDDRCAGWTRRRLGLVAASGMALLHALSLPEFALAKKRRNHKRRRKLRCNPLADICTPGATRKCCSGLRCDRTSAAGTTCCAPEGTACEAFQPCCSRTCDFLVGGGACAPCRGRTCTAERPCCGGLACTGGFCGGCRDRGTSCSSRTQCCFSDCVGGACLSAAGGPCARGVDCRACYLSHDCEDACVDGACTV